MPAAAHRAAQVALLLRQAGLAHHRAFAHVNGEDAEWPAWYADWLHPRLDGLLARTPAAAQLARDLREVEDLREARSPAVPWPEYYAEWLITRYG